jgi:azurin
MSLGYENIFTRAKVHLTSSKTKAMRKSMIVLGVLSLGIVSCSDSSDQSNTTAPAAEQQEAEAPQPALVKEEVSVTIKANDQMKFDLSEIRVPANSAVTLTLVNEGELPKAAMGHNFVLLAKGTDVADYALRAIQAGIAKEHIPSGTETIAYTKLLGRGRIGNDHLRCATGWRIRLHLQLPGALWYDER